MKYIQRAKFRATPEESKTGVDRILIRKGSDPIFVIKKGAI